MDDDKNIDESWKDAVENEKDKIGENRIKDTVGKEPAPGDEQAANEGGMPEVNFIGYITSLAFQTMVFLGEVPNPITNETEKNLAQAKFLIDTLVLLREKTKGNLTDQENDALSGFIYELQMRFVEILEKEGGA